MSALLFLVLLSLGIDFAASPSSAHATESGHHAEAGSASQLFVPQQLQAGKRSTEAIFPEQPDPALLTGSRSEAPLLTSSSLLPAITPVRSFQRRPWTARSPPVIH